MSHFVSRDHIATLTREILISIDTLDSSGHTLDNGTGGWNER